MQQTEHTCKGRALRHRQLQKRFTNKLLTSIFPKRVYRRFRTFLTPALKLSYYGVPYMYVLVAEKMLVELSTPCLKKVPTFELSATLSNLNRFSNFCTAGKRIKFATNIVRHYPSHLRHVATLPWEIKNLIFLQIFSSYRRKCKQMAF